MFEQKKTMQRNIKSTDLAIKKAFYAITIAASCVLFYVNHELMLKAIATICGLLYMLFIIMHIGLGFPLVVIFMYADGFVSKLKLKEKSDILHLLFKSILGLFMCFIVYFIVPLLIAMIYNVSFDYKKAIDTLDIFY